MDTNTLYSYDAKTKWLHSGGETHIVPPGGIGPVIFGKIRSFAHTDLIAQIQYETGTEESYKAFFTKCVKIALYLRDQGLKAGDIISMSSLNNMNNSAVFVATLFNGVILASTDPAMSAEDTKYLLELVEPKLIFVCGKSLDLIQKASQGNEKKIVTLYEHDGFDNVPTILERYSDDDVISFEPHFAEDTRETCIILFSSGTTGMPKAACLSHEMLYSETMTSFESRLRIAIFSTYHWGSGVIFSAVIFRNGATKINICQVAPEDIWDCLHKTKASMTFLVYATLMQIVSNLKQPMPYLKVLCFGGGVVSASAQEALKEKLPDTILLNCYGGTEFGGISSNLGECPPESAGIIQSKDIILKIVDIDTEQTVGLNELGEIRVKGRAQLSKYYKRDTGDIWDEEGFYKTGDVGYLNDKYELYVVDRIKEMFKCAGHLVIPAKLESVLYRHPAIQQALVIGVTKDNLAKAFVVLNDECSITTDELVKYTNDNIEDSRNHLRAGVQFITDADIPYTVSGKVNRRLIRQKFQNM